MGAGKKADAEMKEMRRTGPGRGGETEVALQRKDIRLLAGLALALAITAVFVMSMSPGEESGGATLSQALLTQRTDLRMDPREIAGRVVEQKFQVHMEEMDQQMGEIPYVEIWVLNDPFYPLMGDVGDLRETEGTLSGKQWQMLGFPEYEAESGGGTTGGAPPPSSPPSSLPVTTGVAQRVVLVEEIYEMRGIMYADIKVNDSSYEKLKAGSEFAEVFRLLEIKDKDTVVVRCGDESYELAVNQLRKI